MSDLKWFEFDQNNSGGRFEVTSDLCHRVLVQAHNETEALQKGLDLGVYLNGCDAGVDCGCCGDRWYAPHEVKASTLSFYKASDIEQYATIMAQEYGWTDPDAYIYYADGRKVSIPLCRGKKA